MLHMLSSILQNYFHIETQKEIIMNEHFLFYYPVSQTIARKKLGYLLFWGVFEAFE